MNATSDRYSAAAPAIFSLHDDILLHIFHLNTYTPETEYSIHSAYTPSDLSRPLTVARHASQVCHVWRQTLLGSPAIWGRLIDMTILEASSELWTEEVVKRTGESDLSIYGSVGQRPPSLFNSVLDNNWHRVRKLDICLDDVMPPWLEDPPWEVISGRPAPRLEKFLLRGPKGPRLFVPLVENDGPRVVAPSLRRYHCPILVHDHRETWLPQLSSLTLSYPLSTTDILRILAIAVHLESLTIMNPEGSTPETDWNKIYLPKLVRLDISGTVSQCLFFLQRIVGHPDCALVLHVNDFGMDFSVKRSDLFLDIITPCIARYFDIQRPPRLMMDLGVTFKFQCIKSTDMMYFAHPETSLAYSPSGAYTFDEIMQFREKILTILTALPLGSIVELEIIIHSRMSTGDLNVTPGLLGLIESLSSVQTLIVSPNSFSRLINLSPNLGSHMFPHLKIIQLNDTKTTGFRFAPYSESIPEDFLLFFSQRKVAGLPPVLKLEFAGRLTPYLQNDWRFLNGIEGLRVVRKRDSEEDEYICGSGEKERLNWS